MKISSRVLSFATTAALILGIAPLSAIATNEQGKVRIIVQNNTFTVENGAGWDGVLLDTYVDLNSSSTAVDLILKALEDNGYTMGVSTYGYISQANGLSEYDGGTQSGWNVLLNDWFTNEALSAYDVASGKLENGDEISLEYSCAWGADIGSAWDNNITSLQDIDFSEGKLSSDFESSQTEYTLELSADVDSIIVTPEAINKNFQVRTYKNSYTPTQKGAEFKRGDKIELSDGDKLYIGVGNAEWATMNYGQVETVYTINISKEAVPSEDVVAVEDLINAIGDVTIDSSTAIEKARKAYDLLTEELKLKVNNYDILVLAEGEYASLLEEKVESDKKKASEVDSLINAIGVVKIDSKDKINLAREAYNALTSDQKQFCEKYDVLVSAEKTYENLVAEKTQSLENIYNKTGDYLANGAVPTVSSVGGDWIVLGLSRAGKLSDDFATGYYKNVANYVVSNGSAKLHNTKSTDNSRVIIALSSVGFDVKNVEGYNLLEPLADFDYVTKQGVNGAIWALIALDTMNYEIPVASDKTQTTRENLVEYILSKQTSDGGWALTGDVADCEITAMALVALSNYSDSNEVGVACDKALSNLSLAQNDDGTFNTNNAVTCEATAQVITALTSMGINPLTDARFVKNGNSAIDGLKLFNTENGGFVHVLGSQRDQIATEQGYYALVSYYRLANGQTSLFDMTNTEETKNPEVDINSSSSNTDSKNNSSNNSSSSKQKDESPATGGFNGTSAMLLMTAIISGAIIAIKKKQNN